MHTELIVAEPVAVREKKKNRSNALCEHLEL